MARCMRATFLIKTSTFGGGKGGRDLSYREAREVNWKYYVRVRNGKEEKRGKKKGMRIIRMNN